MSQDLQDVEPRTFVETALELGGKSREESQRTGTLDRADDQVEALFASRYQTAQSPVHRAVSGPRIPARPVLREAGGGRVRRRLVRDHGRVARPGSPPSRARAPCSTPTGRSRASAGRVGPCRLLGPARRPHLWRPRGPLPRFARFLTRMATIDPTVAGLASVHGCIGAVDPLRTFGSPSKRVDTSPPGQRPTPVRICPDGTVRRVGPHGASDHGHAGRRRLCRQW